MQQALNEERIRQSEQLQILLAQQREKNRVLEEQRLQELAQHKEIAALTPTYGKCYCPPRRRTRGAPPKPRLRPRADLWYAQVIKHRRRGRIIAVRTGVVFGDPTVVTTRLAQSPVSQAINTRFVERDNLTQRPQHRRLTRRTNGFSKDITWLEKQLWLSLAYYHLIWPHASLRTPLAGS